jgi:hypothetical protein
MTYTDISLNELFEYINNKIINQYLNVSIVSVFPTMDNNLKPEQAESLLDIIGISDVVIYDKRDAFKFCGLLGYKVEEKNFEVRYMFLKELKRGKGKQQRSALFLDDFHKLTVIMQETESNLIIFHNEFNFDIGFKIDYIKTVTNNYEFLKYVFYGGFFSRIIQGKPFDVAFQVGLETFKKMLELIHNNYPLPEDPDYFVVKVKKPENKQSAEAQQRTSFQESHNKFSKKSNYPQDYSSSPTNYNNAYKNRSGDMSNSDNYDEPTMKKSISPKASKISSNPNRMVEIEQKKLLTILEANEKIQKKLNQLLANPNAKQLYSDDEFTSTKAGKKLPGLKNSENAFTKMSQNNYKSSYERKKNLKPISKETYDRLTGNNRSNYFDPYGYSTGSPKSKEEQYLMMQQLHMYNQSNVNKAGMKPMEKTESPTTSPKKTEEPKKEEAKKEGAKEEGKSEGKKEEEKSPSPSPNKKSEKKINPVMDFSKIDPQLLQSFIMMQQGVNPFNQSSMSMSQIKKPHYNIKRGKKELDPTCNLGYEKKLSEQELKEIEEMQKKKRFKDSSFFDKKHNKTKFKYLEEQKKEILLEEVNKSIDEKGKKEDFNDLQRTIEREEKKRKQKEKEEKEKKEKEEKEKKEKEEKEKKEKEEKEKKEKEEKEKKEKGEGKKEEGKKEEKKGESKKEEPKKEEPKKEEPKKEEAKK